MLKLYFCPLKPHKKQRDADNAEGEDLSVQEQVCRTLKCAMTSSYLNGTRRVLMWHCRVRTRSQTADNHEVRGESQTETSRRVSPVNLLHRTKKYLGRGIRDKCGWIGVLKQVQKDGGVGKGGNKN